MSLDDLMIRQHTVPLEKELNHQKEQKAKWKRLAIDLAKALREYQTTNKLHHDEEARLFDIGKKPLKAFDDHVANTRPRRRR